jgi:hypothetical protein
MTAPISQTAFRGPGDNLIGGVLAHLRLADRLPLRVSCRCRAHWDDPALDQLRFEREVDLGTFGDLAAAMIPVARKSVASGLIAAGRDPALRLAPQFVTILDAEHCLVLAGEVQAWAADHWCAPVDSDAEARRVVNRRLRASAKARAATDAGDPASAAALLNSRPSAGRPSGRPVLARPCGRRSRSRPGRLIFPPFRKPTPGNCPGSTDEGTAYAPSDRHDRLSP